MEKYRYQIVCILIFLVALTILVIVNNRHRTQMQVEAAAQEAYRYRMETDELTGLLNKEGFYQRGRNFWRSIRRQMPELSISILRILSLSMICLERMQVTGS